MSDGAKGSRKRSKARRRYSEEEKRIILDFAKSHGVEKAAKKFKASAWTIYKWRGKASRPPGPGRGSPGKLRVDPAIRKRVTEVWRNNPGFGPSQVANQLKRVGIRCSVKTVRKILRAEGYTPPKVKLPDPEKEPKRFEAPRPLALVQIDVLHFYVHSQKLYLMVALDDYSRFVVGWAILQNETMEDAIVLLAEASRRYGKPEAVLSDRGATFHSWKGVGKFDRFLDEYDIEHKLAAPHHPQTLGKIEALNKAVQKELIDRVEFRNFLDAKAQIAAWVERWNMERTHQGLGGVLVPADRFFGRADEVLARIASMGGSRKKPGDPVPPGSEPAEDREVVLLQLRLVGQTIEVWLFGRLVARLKGVQ
mgnify:CR=1 FL=1